MGEGMMPVGVTIATTAACGLFIAGLGFMAGRLSAPDEVEQVTGLLEAQSGQIESMGASVANLTEAANRPIVIDAEIRDKLADVPPQCRTGQNPASLSCAWASCLRYSTTNGQRPECRAVEAAYLASMACPEPTQSE